MSGNELTNHVYKDYYKGYGVCVPFNAFVFWLTVNAIFRSLSSFVAIIKDKVVLKI